MSSEESRPVTKDWHKKRTRPIVKQRKRFVEYVDRRDDVERIKKRYRKEGRERVINDMVSEYFEIKGSRPVDCDIYRYCKLMEEFGDGIGNDRSDD